MKKFVLSAFVLLAFPAISSAATQTYRNTTYSLDASERYQESLERRREYLRSLYRKNYQGERNTVANTAVRRYNNQIDSWEKRRESIKTLQNIRPSTQKNYAFRNYHDYLASLRDDRYQIVQARPEEEKVEPRQNNLVSWFDAMQDHFRSRGRM